MQRTWDQARPQNSWVIFILPLPALRGKCQPDTVISKTLFLQKSFRANISVSSPAQACWNISEEKGVIISSSCESLYRRHHVTQFSFIFLFHWPLNHHSSSQCAPSVRLLGSPLTRPCYEGWGVVRQNQLRTLCFVKAQKCWCLLSSTGFDHWNTSIHNSLKFDNIVTAHDRV